VRAVSVDGGGEKRKTHAVARRVRSDAPPEKKEKEKRCCNISVRKKKDLDRLMHLCRGKRRALGLRRLIRKGESAAPTLARTRRERKTHVLEGVRIRRKKEKPYGQREHSL